MHVSLLFYFPNGHHGWTLHLVIDELPSKVHHSQFSVLSSSGQIESEKILANEDYEVHDLDVRLCNRADNTGSSKRTSSIRDKEMQRTRKIGQANKGRIPWNKGRTHSEGVIFITFPCFSLRDFCTYFSDTFDFSFFIFRDSRAHQ